MSSKKPSKMKGIEKKKKEEVPDPYASSAALLPPLTGKTPAEQIEELKAATKPPPGRRPMLPRVYEYWTDDDEVEEEIIDEDGNVHKKPLEEGEEEDVFEYLLDTKTRKERQAEATSKYEEFRKREEQQRAIEAEIQRLEDLKFPSKVGWFYTNGYYESQPFGVNAALLDGFAENEEHFREKLAKTKPKEGTFTSRFKRHFWPPDKFYNFCGGKLFRTRGVNLDFDEIDKNKIAQLEVNFEHDAIEMLSNDNVLFKIDADIYAEGDTAELVTLEQKLQEEEEAEEVGTEVVTKKKKKRKKHGVKIMTADGGPVTITGGKDVGWEDFYYDDEDGEFHRKVPGLEVDYYFDGEYTCWRRKRGRKKSDNQMTPYDFYYDGGEFYARELYPGKHDLDISFDQAVHVWKYNPKVSTRILQQRSEYLAPDESVRKMNNPSVVVVKPPPKLKPAVSKREQERQEKEKRNDKDYKGKKDDGTNEDEVGPGDFYFDESDTFWKKKTGEVEKVITFDENGKRWIKRAIGDWRGLTGYSPDDFYWADDLAKFQLKVKHQPELYRYFPAEGIWRLVKRPTKTAPTNAKPIDFYFENGMFKVKEPLRDNLYRKLRYAKIFKRREEPKSGMYPEDYYYDHLKKMWLPRSVRMAVLKTKEEDLPWTKTDIEKGKISKPIPVEDDFWFDIEEGVFVRKDKNLKEQYYFDHQEQVWKNVDQKNLARLRLLPCDFYFNGTEFKRRQKRESEVAVDYDTRTGVYWTSIVQDRNQQPTKFYFDYEAETWRAKTDGQTGIVKDASGRFVKSDKNRSSPHDFYWDDSIGRFFLKEEYNSQVAQQQDDKKRDEDKKREEEKQKEEERKRLEEKKKLDANRTEEEKKKDAEDARRKSVADEAKKKAADEEFRKKRESVAITTEGDKYVFAESEGVFKLADAINTRNKQGFTPKHFYFDENERIWRLKVAGHDREYIWDRNNHIFRHVVSQDTRSGLKASDYYFNSFLGTWMAIANYDRQRGKILNEKLNWSAPGRGYEKPWLKAAPQRYGQVPGTRQKPEVWSGVKRKPYSRPGYMADEQEKDAVAAATGTGPAEEPKIKMTNFDVNAVTEGDIKGLFPKAIKIEINKEEGSAIISFPDAEIANNDRQAKDGVSFKGKNIILANVIEP